MPKTITKQAKKKKTLKRANKATSISKLKKEADRVFSEWNRRRFADKNGIVLCYTSGLPAHWKNMHNGHYISRSILALRWNENNARPQSPAENIWKHGNPIEFRIRLVQEIGEAAVLNLESHRRDIIKITRSYLEGIIALYQKKLSEL